MACCMGLTATADSLGKPRKVEACSKGRGLNPLRENLRNLGGEWGDYLHAIEILAGLQVLRQKKAACGGLRGGNDQAVPPREAETVFDRPCVLEDPGIDDDRFPSKEGADIVAGVFSSEPWPKLSRNRNVKLLQHLDAHPPPFLMPKQVEPRPGGFLLSGIGGVPAVNKYVGVNEDCCGHEAILVPGMRCLRRATAKAVCLRIDSSPHRNPFPRACGPSAPPQETLRRWCCAARPRFAPIGRSPRQG